MGRIDTNYWTRKVEYSRDVTWHLPEVPLVTPMRITLTDPPGDINVPVHKPVSINATSPLPPPASAPAPVAPATPPAPAPIITTTSVPSAPEPPTPPFTVKTPYSVPTRVRRKLNTKYMRKCRGGHTVKLVVCATHPDSLLSNWFAFDGRSCNFVQLLHFGPTLPAHPSLSTGVAFDLRTQIMMQCSHAPTPIL